MREMTTERAAREIARAYGAIATTGQHVMIADVADMVDLTAAEIQAGCSYLNRQAGWHVTPESNQKALTARERAGAVRIGNQDRHLICRS
jgi:hypothetical protein